MLLFQTLKGSRFGIKSRDDARRKLQRRRNRRNSTIPAWTAASLPSLRQDVLSFWPAAELHHARRCVSGLVSALAINRGGAPLSPVNVFPGVVTQQLAVASLPRGNCMDFFYAGVAALKQYKYKGEDRSLLYKHALSPLADAVVRLLPESLA